MFCFIAMWKCVFDKYKTWSWWWWWWLLLLLQLFLFLILIILIVVIITINYHYYYYISICQYTYRCRCFVCSPIICTFCSFWAYSKSALCQPFSPAIARMPLTHWTTTTSHVLTSEMNAEWSFYLIWVRWVWLIGYIWLGPRWHLILSFLALNCTMFPCLFDILWSQNHGSDILRETVDSVSQFWGFNDVVKSNLAQTPISQI